MSMYLFSGLFLFTTFCKHCGESSPSSRQVGTHPFEMFEIERLETEARRFLLFRAIWFIITSRIKYTTCILPVSLELLSIVLWPYWWTFSADIDKKHKVLLLLNQNQWWGFEFQNFGFEFQNFVNHCSLSRRRSCERLAEILPNIPNMWQRGAI